MARVVVTRPEHWHPRALALLRRLGRVSLGPADREPLLHAVADCELLCIRVEDRVDRRLLRAAPRLRVIATATTGLDHIELGEAKRRRIKVVSLHGEHTVPTAEHAWALLLAVARRVPAAHASLSSGRWERARFRGLELRGKTLGIIGIGRIGTRVARLGRAFGMEVLACDPHLSPATVARRGARRVPLGRLLRASDFITLHCPLTGETRGLLDRRRLSLMKPDTVLVNTARGGIVDSVALLRRLAAGRLAGAAIDTLPDEPPRRRDPLLAYARTHLNLVLTPHLGAGTREAVERASTSLARRAVAAMRSE